MSKTMICPNCKEKLNKVVINYISILPRLFNVEENNELEFISSSNEPKIKDVDTICCYNCKNELPNELVEKIKKFFINY